MARINYLYTLSSAKLPDESSQLDFLATNMTFFGSRGADEELDHVGGPGEAPQCTTNVTMTTTGRPTKGRLERSSPTNLGGQIR